MIMEKKNLNLIIIGAVILFAIFFLGGIIVDSFEKDGERQITGGIIVSLIILIGSFLLSFGAINYTKLPLWLKIILIIIIMAVIIYFFFLVGLEVHGM